MGTEEEDVNMLDDDNSGGEVGGTSVGADQERRIRREIANSNERRRMQSINAGFQSLRTLLPHHEGEKLSKAAILQQTAEYIYTLEQEKTRLLQQNSQLKRLLALSQQRLEGDDTSPQLKKKRITTEGETNLRSSDEDVFVSGQVSDLNLQLIQEQRLRLGLEERLRTMEAQLASVSPTTTTTTTVVPTIIKRLPVDEETCRIVVTTQDLSGHPVVAPQTAILLSSEPLPIVEESPAVRDAVDLLPTLTAPQPPVQPQSEIATTTVIEQRSLAQELKGAQELKDSNMSARSFILTTSSRQNLDSIVEAIRHLEGDHLFSEEQQVVKEEVVEYMPADISTAKLSFNPISDQKGNGSIFIINKN